MRTLPFYNRPFKLDTYGTYVYDNRDNLIFQFDSSVPKDERKLIIFRLNALDPITEEIPKYLLTYNMEKGLISNGLKPFIEIRGWGNLTGVGGYNFSHERAFKIQDDLANWLVDVLIL